jgi:hypothetical protein
MPLLGTGVGAAAAAGCLDSGTRILQRTVDLKALSSPHGAVRSQWKAARPAV